MTTPDLIEPFTGWKGLLADEEGGLWSPSVSTFWPVGKPLVAKCETHRGRAWANTHKPPVRNCGCGIYALKTYEGLKQHGYNWGLQVNGMTWVLAEIALYGQVRVGGIGWRASHAAPQAVYVSAMSLPLGRLIAKRYGVDLGMIDRFTGKRKLLTRRP
jgi:hypothetical protein